MRGEGDAGAEGFLRHWDWFYTVGFVHVRQVAFARVVIDICTGSFAYGFYKFK